MVPVDGKGDIFAFSRKSNSEQKQFRICKYQEACFQRFSYDQNLEHDKFGKDIFVTDIYSNIQQRLLNLKIGRAFYLRKISYKLKW